MSLGDDHGYGESSRGTDDGTYGGYAGTGQTRTRLPDRATDPYGGAPRRPRSSSRSLVTIVGVIVLLIAAIAFANRGDDDTTNGTSTGDKPKTAPTTASGERPVKSKTAGIPTGYAQSEQGAQSAATNYTAALGSDGMFNSAKRHQIVATIAAPDALQRLQTGFDDDYSAAFLKTLGLNDDGSAPSGSTFVNRTLPVGAKATSYNSGAATVEVWCNSLFGLTGENTTNPVTNGWFTVTLKLKWADGDWKVMETSQKTGPTPVNADDPVSGADEIGKAVEEFGGFTYAR
ncbi:hypothetical protein [Streptomyces neyagawaensis]|uniref:hypothetical protein n=2 Tax=Streptomyces neyagawaensis TaxID=42238 RepID=UPI00201CFFC9|nr:hypothetical protein [Streptomyces neyagawaensis]MCL6737007.1 hypothetical protein [Streptomyces neyagawaensis]MDE1687342.1 hypothetical protein [Streptomyces neyagawaensis]